jgi:dihydroorotate dehydrogenase (NAD+) catalytic subunit
MSVDLTTRVAAVSLPSPVMTAAGTSGYGDELGGYGDLAQLGAVVVKSLAAFAWEGNDPPRVVASGEHMLNSVGLAGSRVWTPGARTVPGPALRQRGARVVGFDLGPQRRGVRRRRPGHARGGRIVALEVNASCPNLDDRSRIFAHSAEATAEVVAASHDAGLALWVEAEPQHA